jgi:hypothetical protein
MLAQYIDGAHAAHPLSCAGIHPKYVREANGMVLQNHG